MLPRLLPALLAAALLAACSSDEPPQATATGGGNQQPTTLPTVSQPPPQQPIGPPPGSYAEFQQVVGDRVYFDTDQYNIRPDMLPMAQRQAAWLAQYPRYTMTIQGHADERGTREYNLALGERRANSLRDFLVGQGVAANRIRVISYGKERPECFESNESCWQLNRKALIVLDGAPAS